MMEQLLIACMLLLFTWMIIKTIKQGSSLHIYEPHVWRQKIDRVVIGCLLMTVLASWLITTSSMPTASADRMPDMPGMDSSTTGTTTSMSTASSTDSSSTASTGADFNLTDPTIKQQNQSAVRLMNEQALSPTILPDGTKQFVLNASTFAWSLCSR